MKILLSAAFACTLFCCIPSSLTAQSNSHVIAPLRDAQWGPAPPMLPAGARMAVLAGNPMQATPYTIRLQFPANYVIPAHSHPTDENVVVISGALTLGMGEKLDPNNAKNKTLTTGGFALMPAGMNHYAFTTTQETSIVLYGQTRRIQIRQPRG